MRPSALPSYFVSTDTFWQVGHTSYVGPLAWLPAGVIAGLDNGAIVSGAPPPERLCGPATHALLQAFSTLLLFLSSHWYNT